MASITEIEGIGPAYAEKLQSFVYASGQTMRPIFTLAKNAKAKRVAFAEGEEERVLRAVQVVVDEGLARPMLIGRPAIIAARVRKFGLRLQQGADYDVVNVEDDERYRDFYSTYHRMTERKGITEQMAKIEMRRRLSLIGAMLLHKGEVDGLICGTWGGTGLHLEYVDQVIGKRPGVTTYAAMNGLMLPGRQVFLVDTHINYDPSAEQLAEITMMAAEEMMRFGLRPKAALLSHSNFGSSSQPSALKMRRVLELLKEQGASTAAPAPDAYAVIPESDALPVAMKTVQQLRMAGVAVQMHASSGEGLGSMKSQFKKADASGARFALVFGTEELARGEVSLKPLRDAAAAQRSLPLSDLDALQAALGRAAG